MNTTAPLASPYAAVHALLASPLPIPPDAPPRAVLAAQIDHLIDLLDAFDAATEDLEPDADLEPWLAGSYTDRGQNLELDDADREPSLGSPDKQMDQRRWNVGSADDAELDESDHEYSGGMSATDDEPIFGPKPPPSALVGSAVRP